MGCVMEEGSVMERWGRVGCIMKGWGGCVM